MERTRPLKSWRLGKLLDRAALINNSDGLFISVFSAEKLPTLGVSVTRNTICSGLSATGRTLTRVALARTELCAACASPAMSEMEGHKASGSTRQVQMNFANARPNSLKTRKNFA